MPPKMFRTEQMRIPVKVLAKQQYGADNTKEGSWFGYTLMSDSGVLEGE
jgi:hypothetical protein